jgi:hypothetical protein
MKKLKEAPGVKLREEPGQKDRFKMCLPEAAALHYNGNGGA